MEDPSTPKRTEQLAATTLEPKAQTRKMTLDEGLGLALAQLRAERYETAAELFNVILKARPQWAPALHFSGLLASEVGQPEEAIRRIERSLELAPDVPDWHSNFGVLLQQQGQLERAAEAFQRAIALDPRHVNAHTNLGVLLRALGRFDEAEAAYRTALDIDPQHADTWTNLGVLLNARKRNSEAVECFCRAITLRPNDTASRRLLALAHCTVGEIDKAIAIFEEWLAESPDDPIARHMLAACRGDGAPARASDQFVTRTFDSFAATFESKLEQLSYRAPQLVAAMVEDAGLRREADLDVLDAGCGTGLCGPLLAPYARTLVGVDLSAGMLEHAQQKQVYTDLQQAELTAYLREHPAEYDLIVSADTLCYFGVLDEAISAAAAALRPGGTLIFTVERADGDPPPDYHLETHGRYTHARHYTERVLRAAGLEPLMLPADLRLESGAPVGGLVVRGVKPR